uniref:RNF111_N domain-containing protein n=1 Tax=Syphacia muris TaxID=451379 RepID=A0A0N5AVE7_9BILA
MMENTEAGIEECSRLLEASSISCQEQQRSSNKILDETNSDYSSEADDTSINKTSAKSLSVFVDGSFEDQDIVNDATFSSSPTESSDSGVYSLESLFSSQSSSPNLSPVHKTPNRLVKWESVLSQQPVNVRQRSTSEGCGLKSILKRTLPAVERRGRFTRSLSECQQEIEVKVRTSTNGSSEEIDTPDGDDVRKKHVSFSERLVQRHSFRPNSSILGQRKKNQKKSRNKLKKKLLKENLLQTQLDSKDVNELDEQVEYESDVEVEKSTGRRRLLRSSICEESYVVFGSCVMNEDLVNNVIQEEAIEICS